MKVNVKRKDAQNEQQHHFSEQISQLLDATLEFGLRRAQGKAIGDLPEGCIQPRFDDQHFGTAAADIGPHEDSIRPFGEAGSFCNRARLLFDWKCFAG